MMMEKYKKAADFHNQLFYGSKEIKNYLEFKKEEPRLSKLKQEKSEYFAKITLEIRGIVQLFTDKEKALFSPPEYQELKEQRLSQWQDYNLIFEQCFKDAADYPNHGTDIKDYFLNQDKGEFTKFITMLQAKL